MNQLSPRSVLLGILRGRPVPSGLSEAGSSVLADLADAHGLSAVVLSADRGQLLPAAARAQLRRAALVAATSHLRTQADLRRLADLLAGLNLPWVAVKGPVLAEHWYGQHGQRSYGDLDLLVDPRGLAAVLDLLEEQGCQLLDTNWTLSHQQQRAELSLLLPHGTPLDLHWHLLNTPALRREIPLDIDAMLGRRQVVSIGPIKVPTLDQPDTVLHLALHTMLSGGRRLGWYRDLQQAITHSPLDFDELIRRSQQAGAGAMVAVALARTATLTGLDVPRGMLRDLAPSARGWLALLRGLDRLRPLGDPEVQLLSGQLLASASRSSTGTSVRALAVELRRDLLDPLVHDRQHPWRRHVEVADHLTENPLWSPPDSSEDRARYLEAVLAEAGRAAIDATDRP